MRKSGAMVERNDECLSRLVVDGPKNSTKDWECPFFINFPVMELS